MEGDYASDSSEILAKGFKGSAAGGEGGGSISPARTHPFPLCVYQMTGWCSLWVILALASAKQLMQRRARFARLTELCMLEKEEGKEKKIFFPQAVLGKFSCSLSIYLFLIF